MGYRRHGGGGRRDGNEQPIVDALRAVGAMVWYLSGTGNPDLLVLYRDRYTPMETKQPKGTKTKNQTDILWPVVRSPEQALREIGAVK